MVWKIQATERKAKQMSNVNATLSAIMSAGVSGLAAAVRTSHKLDGQIYGSVLDVSAVAAFRIGRAWNQGETAEVKETKFTNAIREFINHYIVAGNHVFRDTADMKEFLTVKRNRDKTKEGPLVRAYLAACKAGGFSKKEHAIAEVQRYAKKIVDDATKNHADFVKAIGRKEDVAELLKVWGEFVADNYGTTIYALAAYFKTEGKAKDESSDPMEKAVTKLLEITSPEELAAMIKRLQARKDELEAGSVAALAAINAGRKSEAKSDDAADAAPEAEKIAA